MMSMWVSWRTEYMVYKDLIYHNTTTGRMIRSIKNCYGGDLTHWYFTITPICMKCTDCGFIIAHFALVVDRMIEKRSVFFKRW